MSKITDAFQQGKAFIPFITCGDPDLETTAKLVKAMEKAGANLIELGIPFSDPTAEGPVIQKANIRALSGGATTNSIFDMVSTLAKEVKVPLVFMTYANVVFGYGIERFLKRCHEIGISGLILPDVPYEEKDEFAQICRQYAVEWISMIAPTSGKRIEQIAKDAEGFLYCVSALGVTGMRDKITTDIASMIKRARQVRPEIPCAVGFGISTPEQAKEIACISDGVIVGSAIVNLVEQYEKKAPEPVFEYVRKMKEAIRS